MKLVRIGTADVACVGFYGAEVETHARENATVAVIHLCIGFVEGSLVRMKGIAVFHGELPRAHNAKTRPPLVAELRLYLVVVYG